jgi:hypothetical protein
VRESITRALDVLGLGMQRPIDFGDRRVELLGICGNEVLTQASGTRPPPEFLIFTRVSASASE